MSKTVMVMAMVLSTIRFDGRPIKPGTDDEAVVLEMPQDVFDELEAIGAVAEVVEIEGVDVVSDRTSTVASGLGAQVDLAGSAPPGVASGEGPGVRVSRAGEGRDIRPGTAVGSSSAQFLGFSGGNRPNPAPQGVVVDGNDRRRGNVDGGRS